MKRRAVVGFLVAAMVLVAAVVHAANACSAATHGRPAQHHGCRDSGTPPCCSQPTSTLAIHQKTNGLPDDVPVASSPVIASAVLASFASDLGWMNSRRAIAAAPPSGKPLRPHLFLRTLLL